MEKYSIIYAYPLRIQSAIMFEVSKLLLTQNNTKPLEYATIIAYRIGSTTFETRNVKFLNFL